MASLLPDRITKITFMIRNYITVALRNLWRNRSFSLINIFGLAVSLSVCMVVISIIIENHSYDTFHSNKDRLGRIVHEEVGLYNTLMPFATAPVPIANFLRETTA